MYILQLSRFYRYVLLLKRNITTNIWNKILSDKKERKGTKKDIYCSIHSSRVIHKHHENARTRVFSVQEMLNARDRYRAAPYETSCSRIYVRHIREGTGLSVVLSVTGRQARRVGEKRKCKPPTVGNGVYRVAVDPKPRKICPRLRSQLQKKGHFRPLTDAFAGEEDRQIPSERI